MKNNNRMHFQFVYFKHKITKEAQYNKAKITNIYKKTYNLLKLTMKIVIRLTDKEL